MLNQNPSKREANPNQNGKQNPTPSSSISLKKEKELKEAAERIWQTYPKKDGKQEGIKAILKRLREGLGEEYLLERVRVYCVCYSGKDKGYVKNAQGWFNQSRYLDASLDDPAPPRDISSLGLEDFRLAYRKVHEGDFSVDFCPEMGKAQGHFIGGLRRAFARLQGRIQQHHSALQRSVFKAETLYSKNQKGENL